MELLTWQARVVERDELLRSATLLLPSLESLMGSHQDTIAVRELITSLTQTGD